MPACNICGGETFIPGPNDRLSESGSLPRCAGCYSLERHRSLRECLDRLPRDMLAWRRAIQFAPDPSLEPTWFRSYEGSQYGGDNSLDLQNIDRPAQSYDFVSLSSVLEFVPDDRAAFSELVRISSSKGIIHCTFTPASTDQPTQHYAHPHGTFGRYHTYGNDLAKWFGLDGHDVAPLRVNAIDPVTGEEEAIHFFCHQPEDAHRIAASLIGSTPPFVVS